MGLFGSIFKAVTGPFRGVGKLLTGDLRGAVGAFGDTAKVAAPILGATGVGLLPAALIGAAGGAMQKADDPVGQRGFGDILSGAAGGAALGAGGHFAQGPLSAIGKMVGVGGGAGAAPAAATAAPSAGSAPSWLSKMGSFVTSNPELTVGMAQTGAGMMGAAQQQAQYQKELDYNQRLQQEQWEWQQQQAERQAEAQKFQQMMNLFSTFRPR
jgi:hypothetical protein